MNPARRILIVDDAESDRLVTRSLLERGGGRGYAIHEVDQGRLAAEACERFQPDCVLLDYRMPDMDGLEVLGQLRRRFGTLRFAVVLQTGLGQETLAVRALKSGAHDYVSKRELTEEMLERTIQSALDKLTLERQKREAEEAMRVKQNQMQALLEAAPCALYTLDLLEGRSVYVSGFCESLTGYSAEEIDQMGAASFLALIHPQDRATVQSQVRALRLAGEDEILECQFRMRHKDGRWRRLSARNRLVSRDVRGVGTVAAGTATEVNGGRVNNGEKFDLIAAQEAAGVAAFVWDVTAGSLQSSPLFGSLFGRGAEAISAGLDWKDWLHPDDRARVATDWERALAGEPLRTEFRVVWPDGGVHWLRAQGRLSGGRLNGGVQEITEEKTRLERLRESNEELERFAYIASHDLQEPLRAVISFGDLLARKMKDAGPESRQYLEFIRQGGARMQALVADLLTFSRVMQADRDQMERMDCSDVLAAVLDGMKPLIEECGAEIQAGELPVILANPQQMAQLFENLLSNAIKFRGPAKPLIRISGERAGRDWKFCVADNGIGFDMIYASRIFEAFKRLHSRSQYPGSGIGLALCKKIVERHGGRIWAESEAGAGSKFWFLIKGAVGE